MPHPTWATLVDVDPSATIRPVPTSDLTTPPPVYTGAVVELEFTDTLGTGAMGVVRLANQPSLDRTVAVKSLRPRTNSEDASRKLLREAHVTGALQHPNIVPIYDIVQDAEQRPHILMKRISGMEWESVIDDPDTVRERFGAGDLLGWNLRILVTLCNALHCAHVQGVLHRDLKPANVMIGEFGEVYLVDWGIACAVSAPPNGRIAGTPRYMAPEMARGEQAGVAGDVYLLGGLLHRILAGLPPHRGTTIAEILDNIPRFSPQYPDSVPQALVDLVRGATALDPADRPVSAEAFRLRLTDFLERRAAVALAARASLRLTALREELQDTRDRKRIYEHLTACRFGFSSSLEAWPDNVEAQRGLTAALTEVARYEIHSRDPSAARALLSSLSNTNRGLEGELAELEAARALEEEHRTQLLRDADVQIGARSRMLLVMLFGNFWVLTALSGHFWFGLPGLNSQMLFAAITLAATLAFCFWARESLRATATNRTTAGLMVASPLSQMLLTGLLMLQGADPIENLVLDNFLYAILLLAAGFAVDVRVLVSALGFALAAIGAAIFAGPALLFTAAALVVFVGNLVWIWWPQVYNA